MSDTITNQGQPHKYFHIMLNMADDDLDPFEYRLLGHYIRLTSGGQRPGKEGIRTTAKITQMSVPKVREARFGLRDKGYIRLVEATDEDIKQGNSATIEIIDRWPDNINRYAPPVQNLTRGEADPVQDFTQPPVQDFAHKEESQREESKTARAVPDAGADSRSQKKPSPSKKKTNPTFTAVQVHLLKLETSTRATGGRIGKLAAAARESFEAVFHEHFNGAGWTDDLHQKCANAIEQFCIDWTRAKPNLSLPTGSDTFPVEFTLYLQDKRAGKPTGNTTTRPKFVSSTQLYKQANGLV